MPKEGRWVEIYLGEHRTNVADVAMRVVSIGLSVILEDNLPFESEWENTETGDTITGYGWTEEDARQDTLDKIHEI